MNEIITIDRLTYGTQGVGHCASGKVLLVESAAPGDVVEVAIDKETAKYCTGHIVRFVEESPVRISPACPFATSAATINALASNGKNSNLCNTTKTAATANNSTIHSCGGCPWMFMDYHAQLQAKRASIVDNVSRALHKTREEIDPLIDEAIPSKRELGFRNKIEMNSHRKNERFDLGFHASGSHDLICPKRCLAAAKGIEKSPAALRGALRYLSNSQDLGIYRVGVRYSVRTHDTEVALWTPPGAFPRKAVANIINNALPTTSIVRVMAHPGKARAIKGVEALSGKGYWEEELCGLRYRISAPSFFQVNSAQAENMIKLVLNYTHADKSSVVADLYCGAGTFTLPLAQTGAFVYGVEQAGSSVRDLRRNAALNGFEEDIEVIGGDATRELPTLGKLDALVVDPPRAGLSKEIITSIGKTRAQRMVYVSCDPATFARDIARLESVGYQLIEATPVDLFPQTYHIETVALLTH